MRTFASFILLTVSWSILGTQALIAQRILYNGDLDNKGKATDAAAKKLTSSVTTDKELLNLAVLEKAQIDRILNSATTTMRRDVERLNTWNSVNNLISGIKDGIAAVNLASAETKNLKQQQAEVDQQSQALTKALAQLKMASKQAPPSLDPVISMLGDVKDLTDFAANTANVKEATQASSSIQKVIDGLKELTALVDSVRTIWSSARAISVDPRTLAPSVEETELAALAVETQYLKELTLLRARQDTDYAEVLSILNELQMAVRDANLTETNLIRSDLAAVATRMNPTNYDQLRPQMAAMVRILHLAASASAQNTIAADIEGVRETLAWRRYQIRTAAIYNGTYETAIQAASSRLTAYYAAGLKPSQIAQLIHDIAAAVSLPKIAF